MLSIPSSIRIFICTTATDMRKQFDGLVAIVSHTFGKDVMTGDYFVFVNRAQNRCKVLRWDRDGFAVWAKRRKRFQIEQSQPPIGDVSHNAAANQLRMANCRTRRFSTL